MKTHIAALLALLLTCSLAIAQDVQPPEPDEQGFVQLFNGKDLTGWDGAEGFWTVRDGAIFGQTTREKRSRGNTFLIWRGGEVRNFELILQAKIHGGNNSGIQYRSREVRPHVVSGYQMEVENEVKDAGFLYHEKGRGRIANLGRFMVIDENGKGEQVGSVLDLETYEKSGNFKLKDWNEYRIVARGNHVVHYINGVQTIELIDNDPKNRPEKGVIALQLHGGSPMAVEFKDIRLRRLPDHYGDAKRLDNGKDLSGWKFYPAELEQTVSIKDGAIHFTGKPNGYIYTAEDHTSYALHLQMRHLEKTNTGVLLRVQGPHKVWPQCLEAQGMTGNMGDIYNIGDYPATTDADRTKGRRTEKMHPSNERPLGEWNAYDITMAGQDLRFAVNGLLQNTATGCAVKPGPIAIQSEGGPIEVRNIVLIPITMK